MSNEPQVFQHNGQSFTLEHRRTGGTVQRSKYLLGPASWDRVARDALARRDQGGTTLYRAVPAGGRWRS